MRASSASTPRRPRRRPGVLGILTGKDAAADGIGLLMVPMPEDVGGPKGHRARRPLLAVDKVRAVGDRVAFVVAETLEQAQDAAELLAVEYEMLPSVTSVDDAVKPGAPAIWDECPGNVTFTLAFGNKDATDAAFAKARHTVSLRLESNRLSANSIEPRAAIGDYNAADDAYTLHATSQNPHGNRSQLATNVLKIPETKLRVISPDVGGGFGMKCGGYPEDGLVLWASRRVGRPVKWVSTRSEGTARRHPWPRPGGARRARARRQRQGARPARPLDARGRLAQFRLDDGEHLFHRQARARRLRHPGAACGREGRLHQHRPGASLSRRRPPGGDLSDRAAARPRGVGDRHRSGRDPAAQFHPSVADAAQDRHQHHLRQRRLRACDGRVPQARGLDGLRQARRRFEEERQAARARPLLFPRRGLDAQRAHGCCASIRAAW